MYAHGTRNTTMLTQLIDTYMYNTNHLYFSVQTNHFILFEFFFFF